MSLVLATGYALGTLAFATGHYAGTLTSSKKGSLTNRHQAGNEHFKNDLALGLKTGLIGGAAAIGCKNPQVTKNIAKNLGKATAKIVKFIADKFPKIGVKQSGLLKTIAKNPTKAGAAGIVLAGAALLLNTLMSWTNKKGRIDQKYEDAARIESQTKNVVLEAEKQYRGPVNKVCANEALGLYC